MRHSGEPRDKHRLLGAETHGTGVRDRRRLFSQLIVLSDRGLERIRGLLIVAPRPGTGRSHEGPAAAERDVIQCRYVQDGGLILAQTPEVGRLGTLCAKDAVGAGDRTIEPSGRRSTFVVLSQLPADKLAVLG